MVTDITTATPVEIDTALAELDGRSRRIRSRIASIVNDLHEIADDKSRYVGRRRQVWTMTNAEAERIAREKIAAGTVSLSCRFSAEGTVARLDAYRAELAPVETETGELNAEYARRPWNRFFVVQNNGGHVHSSMSCQTCNNGTAPTEFGWLPEWSGRSEDEALVALRETEKAIMCSICFPNAPVEWHSAVAKPVDERYCVGRGRYGEALQMRYASPRGTCPECKQTGVSVSSTGKVLKHKKPGVE
jgi:hypothetical protein